MSVAWGPQSFSSCIEITGIGRVGGARLCVCLTSSQMLLRLLIAGVRTLRPTGPEVFFLSSPLVKEGLEEVTDTASWSRDEKP